MNKMNQNHENVTVFKYGYEPYLSDTECETPLLPLLWAAVTAVGLNLDLSPEKF